MSLSRRWILYSTYNEGKSVIAERFIWMLKNNIFKHMKAVWNNFYIDVLDDIVNKYNNTVHRTIKTRPIDVKSNSYAEYNEDFNLKDTKFKIGDRVRISIYKKIFTKGYIQNGSQDIFVVVNLKIQFHGFMLLVTWMVNQLLEVFMKKN